MGLSRFTDRTVAAVALAVVVGTVARVYALGRRTMQFDEAWFGYWVLRSMETGVWEYRPVLHGPFFHRVNPVVFDLLGATDATTRLVVAFLGGTMPAAALLFRERLRDVEVLALATVLAGNPILLYYGRFMRFDVPLAAFALWTVAFSVRLLDTGRRRYGYAAGVTLGLAASTKESFLLYLLTWVGALVLVADRRVLARVLGSTSGRPDGTGAVLRAMVVRLRAAVDGHLRTVVGTVVLFLAVVVFFYAPRAADPTAPGFRNAFWRPRLWPAVVGEATVGSLEEAVRKWVFGTRQDHPYLPYLGDTLAVLAEGAPAVVGFGVVGFLAERYGQDHRDIVAFSFYSGVAAVFGYPLANHFPVPWSTVHAVVPFAISAAVGIGLAIDRIRAVVPVSVPVATGADTPEETDTDRVVTDGGGRLGERLLAVFVGVVLVVAAVSAGATGLQTSYRAPHDSASGPTGSELVYYSQPPAGLNTALPVVEEAVSRTEGVDVLFFGDRLRVGPEEDPRYPPIPRGMYNRIPLPWYVLQFGANVTYANESAALLSDPPPVVVADGVRTRQVERLLEDPALTDRRSHEYTVTRYRLDDRGHRTVVIAIRDDLLERIYRTPSGPVGPDYLDQFRTTDERTAPSVVECSSLHTDHFHFHSGSLLFWSYSLGLSPSGFFS
jgi:uncharacterized protein (TIGR03663 family)